MAVSSSPRCIQELHSAGLGSPLDAIVDVLRSDMARDLPNMEKSGVLPWKEPCADLALPETLSATFAASLLLFLLLLSMMMLLLLLVSGLMIDFMSELDSNANCLSFALRRLKQMETRIRKALPPIAKTMAVVMLMIDLILWEDAVGGDVGDGNGVEIVDGHAEMLAPVPQSPVLLLYVKPCWRPNNPVVAYI